MTKNNSPADSTPSLAAQIDRLCDQFEAAWRNNQTPRIEDYLADWMSKDHAGLIRKLLRTELEVRRKSGDQPTAEEYLQRFADHAKVVHAVFSEYEATGKVQETIDFPGKQLDRNATSQSTLSHGDAVTLPPTGQLTPFVGNDLWLR